MAEVKERSPMAVDPEWFADLFFDIETNREQIWTAMGKIVVHAARGVRVRTFGDMQDYRGAALAKAMEKLAHYNPKKRTAYFYFYQLVKREMRGLCQRKRPLNLGEADVDVGISLDHFREVAIEVDTQRFQAGNPRNWVFCRLQNRCDRESAHRYFNNAIRKATATLKTEESPEARMAALLIIETLQQGARAMLGSRITPAGSLPRPSKTRVA